jgi:outer membrane protein W
MVFHGLGLSIKCGGKSSRHFVVSMKGGKYMGRRIGRSISLFLIVSMFIAILSVAAETRAGTKRFDVSIGGGAGYIPMSDWEDFVGSSEGSYYQHEVYGTCLDFRVTYLISGRHAISANIENITTSASTYFQVSPSAIVIDWQFRSIPIGLSYEYYFTDRDDNIQPYVGLGVSYCFTKVKSSLIDLSGLWLGLDNDKPRRERGYHVTACIGLKSYINRWLFVESRLRGRYADGGGFTDEKGAIKINFSGIDLTATVGFSF